MVHKYIFLFSGELRCSDKSSDARQKLALFKRKSGSINLNRDGCLGGRAELGGTGTKIRGKARDTRHLLGPTSGPLSTFSITEAVELEYPKMHRTLGQVPNMNALFMFQKSIIRHCHFPLF